MAAAPEEDRVHRLRALRFEDQERLAARLLAFAGLWFLLSGLLLVLSFVVAALVAFAAMFSALIAV